jgi:ATP-dependent protease ClpP protease subunit
MATLNSAGRAHARSLIADGKVDKSSAWSFSADDGNKWLGPEGDDWANYGKHFLGLRPDSDPKTKDHFEYPCCKGETVYRSGLTAIRQRASAQNDTEVFDAAGALLETIDGEKKENVSRGYRIKAQGTTGAEIFLYDVIGGGYLGGISAAQIATDLRSLGPVRTLDVRINSDGGDVFEGTAIYSLLNQHPANKSVYVDGLAASIASLIAMAGNSITMSDGAMMMVHNAWGMCIGNSAEMRKQADLLDSIDKTLCQAYAGRTSMDPFKITDMMNAETWMTAAECLKNGFCTNVVGVTQARAQVRDWVLRAGNRRVQPTERFKNLPASMRPRLAKASAEEDRLRRLLAAAA